MSQAAEKRGGIPAMLKDTAFVWEDPLDLESELTEEERMVRNSTRGFAQSYLMPRVIEAFRDEKYDPGLLPEMGKLGQIFAALRLGPVGIDRVHHQRGLHGHRRAVT